MTITTEVDSPREIIDDVRALRATSADAERAILVRAGEWADAHPALDPSCGSWEEEDHPELPNVLESSLPEFAAALGMSTGAGQRLVLEVLEARHRLPLCWGELLAGRVEAWRLRMIAQRTLLEPGDVVAEVDRHLAPVAGRVGSVKVDKLVDEALMRLHPSEWEERQHAQLDRRYVRLFDQVTHNGVAEMRICAELADLLGFDTAVSVVAARLGELGDTDSLDVRRAKAVGILADPEAAIELLTHQPADNSDDGDDGDGDDGPGGGSDTESQVAEPAPGKALARIRRDVVLHVHLSEAAITGTDPVGRLERGDQPVLEQLIRRWCGRSDTHLKVYPVRDLADHQGVGQYEAPDRLKDQVEQSAHTCVFPWCTRPARRCDKDHNVPHESGGATCSCNLAPLCRRHHRLKTHTAWLYDTLEVGSYLWTSPFGKQYLRDNTGTTDVTPPHRPPGRASPTHPDTGCFYDRN